MPVSAKEATAQGLYPIETKCTPGLGVGGGDRYPGGILGDIRKYGKWRRSDVPAAPRGIVPGSAPAATVTDPRTADSATAQRVGL